MKTICDISKAILDFVNDYSNVFTLLFAIFGSYFGLHQWRIQIKQKRAEIIENLTKTIRGDKDIATVMDIIDWDEGIVYNGKFQINKKIRKSALTELDDDTLFKMIDKTLAHFSYICYLNKQGALSSKDIKSFMYNLRRITDNPHIRNYLFTLYHWSEYLAVPCSFCHLIDYSIKKGYLQKDFKSINSKNYHYYLEYPKEYVKQNNL